MWPRVGCACVVGEEGVGRFLRCLSGKRTNHHPPSPYLVQHLHGPLQVLCPVPEVAAQRDVDVVGPVVG